MHCFEYIVRLAEKCKIFSFKTDANTEKLSLAHQIRKETKEKKFKDFLKT